MSATDFRRDVYEAIRKEPLGMPRRQLQKRFGVSDPSLEENRAKVWRIAAALASLAHERFITTHVYFGEIWIYPQMA